MKEVYLTIVSPERTVFEGKVSRVTFPGKQGRFEVLPGHAPLISILKSGDICYVTDVESKTLSISSGFVEVSREEVSVCVEI